MWQQKDLNLGDRRHLDLASIFGGGRELDSGNSFFRKLSRELYLVLSGISSWYLDFGRDGVPLSLRRLSASMVVCRCLVLGGDLSRWVLSGRYGRVYSFIGGLRGDGSSRTLTLVAAGP